MYLAQTNFQTLKSSLPPSPPLLTHSPFASATRIQHFSVGVCFFLSHFLSLSGAYAKHLIAHTFVWRQTATVARWREFLATNSDCSLKIVRFVRRRGSGRGVGTVNSVTWTIRDNKTNSKRDKNIARVPVCVCVSQFARHADSSMCELKQHRINSNEFFILCRAAFTFGAFVKLLQFSSLVCAFCVGSRYVAVHHDFAYIVHWPPAQCLARV